MSPDDRVLLVRFTFPDRELWAAPGGGVNDGEELTDALRRELHEEVGHVDADIGPPIWIRRHLFAMAGNYDGQLETFFLVRVTDVEPRQALLTADQLLDENVTGIAWWSVNELLASDGTFAPRRLPQLVAELLAAGPPKSLVDVGI